MYHRKTRDVWHILVNYGHGDGWEHECTEMSWREARDQLRTYRENVPGVAIKARRKRERIDENEVQHATHN